MHGCMCWMTVLSGWLLQLPMLPSTMSQTYRTLVAATEGWVKKVTRIFKPFTKSSTMLENPRAELEDSGNLAREAS